MRLKRVYDEGMYRFSYFDTGTTIKATFDIVDEGNVEKYIDGEFEHKNFKFGDQKCLVKDIDEDGFVQIKLMNEEQKNPIFSRNQYEKLLVKKEDDDS